MSTADILLYCSSERASQLEDCFTASAMPSRRVSNLDRLLEHLDDAYVGGVIAEFESSEASNLSELAKIQEYATGLPVLVLTGKTTADEAAVWYRRGVFCVLEQHRLERECIHRIVTEMIVHSMSLSANRKHVKDVQLGFNQIPSRAREVLSRYLDGESAQRTADALGITKRAVEKHRSAIRRCLKVNSMFEVHESMCLLKYSLAWRDWNRAQAR